VKNYFEARRHYRIFFQNIHLGFTIATLKKIDENIVNILYFSLKIIYRIVLQRIKDLLYLL